MVQSCIHETPSPFYNNLQETGEICFRYDSSLMTFLKVIQFLL